MKRVYSVQYGWLFGRVVGPVRHLPYRGCVWFESLHHWTAWREAPPMSLVVSASAVEDCS